MAIYRKVLAVPGFAVLIASTTLTRVPFAINGLAVILFVRAETGSFATAGVVAGALALGAAVSAPVISRLVDSRGVIMLVPLATVNAGAILLLIALGKSGAPAPLLLLCGFAIGVAFPPSGSVLRSRWPQMLGGDAELLRGAYALDSVTIEVSFVTGPLITAGLVALVSPVAALIVSAVLVLVGTLVFVRNLPAALSGGSGQVTRGWGPLRAPAIRLIALSSVPVGFCIGAIEVAIPAFSADVGDEAMAGILLAIWSAASGVGGLVFGARSGRHELMPTFFAIAILFPFVCLPLAVAQTPLAMGLLVVLAGAPIAPLIATRNELVAFVAPDGTGTEAFSWLITSLVAGLSLGTAVSGAIVEAAGWPEAVLLGCAVALAGALVAFARRGSLSDPAPA